MVASHHAELQEMGPPCCSRRPSRSGMHGNRFRCPITFRESGHAGGKTGRHITRLRQVFDRFACPFFKDLFEAIGIPPAIWQTFDLMYRHIERKLKINGHLDESMRSSCGAGQGDSYSLLGALCITTIEFRMLDHRWPRVHKGSVVDDRDLVVKADEVMGATLECLSFDKKAGLKNNIPKFLGLANINEDREYLAQTRFEGHVLRVTSSTALMGITLTARRSIRRSQQDMRCTKAIEVAQKIAGLKPPEELRKLALEAAAIPAALYGNLWTLPSNNSSNKLSTAIIKALFDDKRGLRCPEIVTTLFMNPTRAAPTMAIAYKNIMDVRRLVLKDRIRLTDFCINLELARDTRLEGIQGPAHGLYTLAGTLGCGIVIAHNANEVLLVCEQSGRAINLLTDDLALLKWNLRDFASRAILQQLILRVDPKLEGGPERKDMVGISAVLDKNATLYLASRPHKCECNEDTHHVRLAIRTILSGAPMFGDRLAAAKLIATDVCDHPECHNARCTAEHWFYHCHYNADNQRVFRETS